MREYWITVGVFVAFVTVAVAGYYAGARLFSEGEGLEISPCLFGCLLPK